MAEPSVVVTGIGAFSPIGISATATWDALLQGASGARTLPYPWVGELQLPVTFAAPSIVEPETVLDRVESKRLDRGSQFSLIAARDAWADAGRPEVEPERLGVDWATGIGGVWTLLNAWDTLKEKGPRRVLPMTVPMLMPNAPAAAIEMEFAVRGGARTAVSACASSTESIANAFDHIRAGLVDVVIAGGCEASIHGLPLAAFASMQALSKRNDDPPHASRPYDAGRDGFVLAEGAAAVVLESEAHARARGARVYGRVVGSAVSSDAHHITAPDPEGSAAARAMTAAVRSAGRDIDEVAHVNAHATSTPVGDVAEYNALRHVFGDGLDDVVVTATKASTGHLLGAAGAIEAIFTLKALTERTVPPTINLTDPDPAIVLDVATEPRPLPNGDLLAISNSFGFGGHNAVVAFASA